MSQLSTLMLCIWFTDATTSDTNYDDYNQTEIEITLLEFLLDETPTR